MTDNKGFYLAENSLELKQVQCLQLNLLLEIDRICRRHVLPYYLIFGTLLGAKRHGGFIPWDDDIDLGFMRKDFDRLIPILKAELDGDLYQVQIAALSNQMTCVHAKVRCLHTLYQEVADGVHHEQSTGVFIDLFPLDVLPDDPKARQKLKRDYLMIEYALRAKIQQYRPSGWVKRLVIKCLSLRSHAALLHKRHQIVTRHLDESSSHLIAFPTNQVEYDSSSFLRYGFEPAIDIDFCGHSVMAPLDVEGQLSALFGDYMSMPPIAERHGHLLSQFMIDLEIWQAVIDQRMPDIEAAAPIDALSSARNDASNQPKVPVMLEVEYDETQGDVTTDILTEAITEAVESFTENKNTHPSGGEA